MAVRWYVSDVVGTGTEGNPFRPAAANVLTDWRAWDGRADDAAGGGWMLVRADTSPGQHATLIADSRNRHLPLDAGLNTPLSSLTNAQINAIRTWAENNHIPLDGLTGENTFRDLLRRIEHRTMLRLLLKVDDWTEHLDTLVSQVPAQKRGRINQRLTAIGYDTSVIQGSDTIRQALVKLLAQNIAGTLSSVR